MSQVTLLRSKIELTKKYTKLEDDSYDVEPYPHAVNVSSHVYPYESIAEFRSIIAAAGNNGLCMLKGQLDREITEESRAGHTDAVAPTDLLVLDYDCSDGFTTPDELLAAIDPALEAVSYVWQPSASTAIKPNPIRGHAFVRLTRPVPPTLIKQWVIKLNLTIPELRRRIRLSKNGLSLCYPLDITVNQNDKLIYIAPPICVGFHDPIAEDRIRLIERSDEFYDLNPTTNTARNDDLVVELVADLRKEAGHPPRVAKWRDIGGVAVLANPNNCSVSGVKERGEFVYLNLEGGDSWGYYYYKNNPELLRNFKHEPWVRLRDICPDHWVSYVESRPQNLEEYSPLVFRDAVTDTYYNAVVDIKNDVVKTINPASSKEKLTDFVKQFGKDRPDIIQDWTYEFDPAQARQIDLKKRWINAFSPSPFMLMHEHGGCIGPTIEKVIRHICVTDEHYLHFINWLAFIFQTRQHSQTAWLFHGTHGTGKGTLFHRILTPLFGSRYTKFAENDTLEDSFTAFLENKLILFVDEASTKESHDTNKIMAKLKTWITEPMIPIRAMRRVAVDRPNFLNIIVASNQKTPIHLEENDRRWNICPRQNEKIDLALDYDNIPSELDDFARYLNAYKASASQARAVLRCEAREEMVELNRTGADCFFTAIRKHDIEFFLDFLNPNPPLPASDYYAFENVIKRWVEAEGEPVETEMRDLMAVYKHTSGKRDISEKSFGWLMRNNGLLRERKRIDGIRGQWTLVQLYKSASPPDFTPANTNVLDFHKKAS
jgi:hypothetical protein